MRLGATVLADTSVWLDHFRSANRRLERLVARRLIVCHPLVIGELCVGNLHDRDATLQGFDRLDQTFEISHADTHLMIEAHDLFGRGLGYIDAMLLASVLVTPSVRLWTKDRRLRAVAKAFDVDFPSAQTT